MTPHLPYFCLNFSKYTFFVFRSFFDEKRPLIFRFSKKVNFREIYMPYLRLMLIIVTSTTTLNHFKAGDGSSLEIAGEKST